MRMILSSHKITYAPSQSGVVTVSKHHFDLEYMLFLCNDKVTRMSAYWRCFAVSDGYVGDGNHPRKLLMHTGVITITTYQISVAQNHQYALMSMFISSHKIMRTPRQGVL